MPGLRVIETPTISAARRGVMARSFEGAMRSGIADDAAARVLAAFEGPAGEGSVEAVAEALRGVRRRARRWRAMEPVRLG